MSRGAEFSSAWRGGRGYRLLFIFGLLNVVSVFGYWFFGLNPSRLAGNSLFTSIFSSAFPFFAQAQMWLALLVWLALMGRYTVGRVALAFFWTFVVALLAELGGTGLGLPFGLYEYSDMLGFKLFGMVPIAIPVSWFYMATCCYLIVSLTTRSSWKRIHLSAFLLMVWDLALDPAMTYLIPYWSWKDSGSYYGAPLLNFVGWYGTGIVLAWIYERMQLQVRAEAMPLLTWFYAINAGLPFCMLLIAGEWLGASVFLVGLLVWYLQVHYLTRQRQRFPYTSRLSETFRS